MEGGAGDAESAGDVAEGEPLGAELVGAYAIEDGGRSADALSEATSALDAGTGASGDLTALLLGDPGEDRDEEVSDGASGVEPGLADADDLDAEVVEGEDVLDVADMERPSRSRAKRTTAWKSPRWAPRWSRSQAGRRAAMALTVSSNTYATAKPRARASCSTAGR